MTRASTRVARALRATLVLLALLPAVRLALELYRAWIGEPHALGADPVEYIQQSTGLWSVRFLALTLAVTPLRRLTGWGLLARYRRPAGLLAFFYAALHFAAYLVLDASLDADAIVEDVLKRTWITIGLLAFLLLVPLAVTSTTGWVRRLGARRWRRLHSVVYVAAAAAVVHYLLAMKLDVREPLVYAVIITALLLSRLPGLWPRAGAPARARRQASSGYD